MSSTSPAPAPAKRRRGPLTKLAFAMLTLFVFLVFIEGLFSTVHIAHTFISKAKSPVAERSHTQYDEDLGWAPIPNLKLADGYGPAVPIQINGQGFRANVEYDAKPAEGKIRIIASGDSFTFGHSVGDDHTWPRYLQSLDERFEVVNVGLGGYGLDQIYLRHERDAAKLERRFHIFAFIMEDFDRAMGESFNGYGKPQLTIKDGQLVTLHQPVPRRGFVRAFLNQNGPLLNEARTISVGSQIWNKVSGGGGARAGAADAGASNQAIFEQTLAKMWETLAQREKERGSRLILAFIPAERDHAPFSATDQWRTFVKATAAKLDVPFFDLVEAFRAVPVADVPSHYLDPTTGGKIYHRGNKGNEWLARQIHERLKPMLK